MMSDTSKIFISSRFSDSSSVCLSDQEQINALIEKYPYFTPARYLNAAHHHKFNTNTFQLLTSIYAHVGNWSLFCDFIDSTNENKATEISAVTEQEQRITIKKDTKPTSPSTNEHQEKVELEHEGINIDIAPIAVTEEEQMTIIEAVVIDDFTVDSIDNDDTLFSPVYTEDYFLFEGIRITDDLSAFDSAEIEHSTETDEERSLMVMMSFTDWLLHFKTTSAQKTTEEHDKRILKTNWQKEKLAAAMEEENEEIPEQVFEMAMNSIAKQEGLASESLADIYVKQKKYDAAIEMYRKLSLIYPEKSTYFARKIEDSLKEK